MQVFENLLQVQVQRGQRELIPEVEINMGDIFFFPPPSQSLSFETLNLNLTLITFIN